MTWMSVTASGDSLAIPLKRQLHRKDSAIESETWTPFRAVVRTRRHVGNRRTEDAERMTEHCRCIGPRIIIRSAVVITVRPSHHQNPLLKLVFVDDSSPKLSLHEALRLSDGLSNVDRSVVSGEVSLKAVHETPPNFSRNRDSLMDHENNFCLTHLWLMEERMSSEQL